MANHKRHFIRDISVLFVLTVLVSGAFTYVVPKVMDAFAVAPPNIVNYQGRLLNANGAPVSDASLSMEFRLFDAVSGGTCLWSNSSTDCDTDTPASTVARTVTLTDGLFSENLGDTSLGSPYAAIPDSVFSDNASLYLEIEIAGETLSPRKRIVASGFSLNSGTLDGLDSTDLLAAAGDTATGEYDFTGAEFLGASPLVFEGTTNDGTNLATFAFTDPTAPRTITFKDESGTVAYLSDITGGTDTLDDAYNNYGATASIINVDAAESQTGGLEFSIDGGDDLTVDLQSTGDFVVQDAGTDVFTIDDSALGTFANNTATSATVLTVSSSSLTSGSAGDFVASGAGFSGNVLKARVSSASASGTALTVQNQGTGESILVDQNGNTGSTVSDSAGGALHISNTGNTGFGFTLYSNNSAPDQALAELFADNATFDEEVLYLLNDGTGDTLFIDSNNSAATSLSVLSDATTANSVEIAAASTTSGTILSLTGGNFTDDSGTALAIDVTEDTSTADIFTIQTDVGSSDNDVFRIEGDGEAFSDVGFSAGGTTNYYDGSITDNDANADDLFDVNLAAGADSFRILTGNLLVGNGSPDVAVDGEDLYVNGTFEADGAARLDGALTVNDTAAFNDDVDFTFVTDGANSENFLVQSTHATDVALSVFDLQMTDSAAASTATNYLASFQNNDDGGATGTPDGLVLITNADTNEAVASALEVTAAGGGITSALDLSDSDITNALDVDGNFILYDGVRVFEGATGTLTWEDTSGNDLMTLTDAGTTGNLDVTARLNTHSYVNFAVGNLQDVGVTSTLSSDSTYSPFYVEMTNDAAASTGSIYLASIFNRNEVSATGTPDGLMRLVQEDTNETVADGLLISNATGGTLTDAIDVSDADITNALNAGANFILYDGIRVFEGATGTLTWEDTSGNDLATLVDGGTTGTLNITGDLTCTNCLDFSDFENTLDLDAATEINLGANAFTIDLDNSGDFSVLDGGATLAEFRDNGLIRFTTSSFVIDATATSPTAADFGVSGDTLYIGAGDGSGNGGMTWKATDGDEGNIVYTTSDLWQFANGGVTFVVPAASQFQVSSSATTTDALNFNSSTLTSGDLLSISATNGSMTGHVLNLANSGTGSSIFLDPNGDTGTTVSDSAGGALHLTNTGNADFGFTVYSNNSAPDEALAELFADNTTFDEPVLDIENDGTGPSLYVNPDNDTGSTFSDTAGGAVHISNTGNNDTAFSIYSNNDFDQSEPLAYLYSDNNTTDQPVLSIRQDGNIGANSIYIDQGYTEGFTSASAIAILSNSSASDISITNDTGTDGTHGVLIRACLDADPTASCNFLTLQDGDGDILGAIEGDGAGGVTNASAGSDYAELFPGTYSGFSAGDILALDASGNIKLASSEEEMIGTFSVAPNTLGNWVEDWQSAGTYVPVALLGQVPVNVTDENGSISVGDYLTLSSTSGVAMKQTGPGYAIGVALEDHAAGSGRIQVYISLGWHAGGAIALNGTDNTFTQDFLFDKSSTADATTQGKASRALSFRGSGWNGASADDVDMTLFTDVNSSSDYQLSIQNDAGTEVASVNQDGDLAIAGRLYPSDQGTLQTDKYIYYDSTGAPALDYMRTNAAGWGVGSYDFAEMFPSEDTLVPGEVVVFASGDESVGRSGEAYDRGIAGIVSTRPGFLAGEFIEGHVPVALAGRVPTFVTAENGSIMPGDPLTTSSVAGYAMKATEPGPIVGYAMEPLAQGTGSIVVYVNVSYYDGGSVSDAPAANNSASGIANLSGLSLSGNMSLGGGTISSVAAISGIGNIWSIEPNGDFVTHGRITSIVESYGGEDVETYGVTSRDTTIQLSGTVQLQNGTAVVDFSDVDPKFQNIISNTQTYRVFLTANGATGALYAANREQTGFVIKESNGSSNVVVDWLVMGYHKDYEPEENSESAQQTADSAQDAEQGTDDTEQVTSDDEGSQETVNSDQEEEQATSEGEGAQEEGDEEQTASDDGQVTSDDESSQETVNSDQEEEDPPAEEGEEEPAPDEDSGSEDPPVDETPSE